jgi:ankyrin repeat protein
VAYLGFEKLVRGLLEGQDLSVVDGSGRTPLWWAAARGQTEVVKLLIEAEAER